MFRALLPLAGFFFLLLMVAAGAGAASGTLNKERPAKPARPVRPARPDRDPLTLSELEIIVAVLVTVIAIPVTIWVLGESGGAVAMVPVVLWLLIVMAVLIAADARRERTAAEERAAAEAARADARHRAKAEEWAARRALADYGAAGVALLGRADTALAKIAASEAMKTGWLGRPEDFSLQGERAVIADDLRTAREIRRLAKQSQRLGTPESAATGMDAERVSRRLHRSAEDWVAALESCADNLDCIDAALAEQRRQAEITQKQDELESRLAALMYTIEAAGSPQRPDSVEAIQARAAAVREVAGFAPPQSVGEGTVQREAAPQTSREHSGGIFGAVARLFGD